MSFIGPSDGTNLANNMLQHVDSSHLVTDSNYSQSMRQHVSINHKVPVKVVDNWLNPEHDDANSLHHRKSMLPTKNRFTIKYTKSFKEEEEQIKDAN